MTTNERKRKERARKSKEGWVRFETWIKPAWAPKLKKFIQALKGE